MSVHALRCGSVAEEAWTGVGGDWGGGDDEVSGRGGFGEGWRVGKRWGVGGSTDFLGRGQRGRGRCVGWGVWGVGRICG